MNGGAALHDPLDQPTRAEDSLDGAASTSNAVAPSAVTIQSEAARLTTLKDSITARLDVYFDVLKTNKSTLSTPLVDPQGFPRADIDVAAVRTARHQIICLRNDLKSAMNEMSGLIERGLPRLEGDADDNDVGHRANSGAVEGSEERKTWARVNAVTANSPAELSGLVRDDLIVSFGDVNASNHDQLKALAVLVGKSEGVTLPLVVLRDGSILHLRLTPNADWGGRGLLGCHVVPI